MVPSDRVTGNSHPQVRSRFPPAGGGPADSPSRYKVATVGFGGSHHLRLSGTCRSLHNLFTENVCSDWHIGSFHGRPHNCVLWEARGCVSHRPSHSFPPLSRATHGGSSLLRNSYSSCGFTLGSSRPFFFSGFIGVSGNCCLPDVPFSWLCPSLLRLFGYPKGSRIPSSVFTGTSFRVFSCFSSHSLWSIIVGFLRLLLSGSFAGIVSRGLSGPFKGFFSGSAEGLWLFLVGALLAAAAYWFVYLSRFRGLPTVDFLVEVTASSQTNPRPYEGRLYKTPYGKRYSELLYADYSIKILYNSSDKALSR